jgi:hypothetical protein
VCQANRLAGPFDHPPFVKFRVSPLGVVPKKALGEYRLIRHLSLPSGDSVNDGIAPEHTLVSCARVDDAVTMIKRLGRGSFLAKTDIKCAFRITTIRPSDCDLLGTFWQRKYYYDRAIPMGCASSCRTFEMFSTALEWVAKKHLMITHLIHILDDYLMLLISSFLRRKKFTLREIQSLNGLLNFACSAVIPVRAFLRRLIDLTKGISAAHYYIRLTKSVKADLSFWQTFMLGFNDRSFFLNDVWQDSLTLNLYTDAAASLDYGAIFGNEWCFGACCENWKHFNITILQFYPIILSVLLWGDRMSSQRVTFSTDNAALVDIINKATSRDSTVMIFVRQLVLACLNFNILFRARHVPGVKNVFADSLSRLQVTKFKQPNGGCTLITNSHTRSSTAT